jgi:hypothetical protein
MVDRISMSVETRKREGRASLIATDNRCLMCIGTSLS